MSRNPEADEVWRAMTALVTDNRDSWRRATVDQTGLPLSRIRILLRLSRGSMTVKEVAHAVTIDPPAATVAVNDLEDRGLVMRQTIPTNRRYKVVSLTDAGWSMVATINAVDDPARDCGSNGVSGTDTLSDARRERCRDDDTGRCGEEEGG
ncbi:MarR family winged helix-turn-helix transcriptional regulator [Mycolicibacterium crocinum]|uniref:MarR family winged helix-turn-helix transcriptional regulator n=1 Tax=Mycolicibacterium crocinum TaxID=388459 RepID=A0ABY3TLY9_9MYCO|nr:MarR family winged helix-turn-helix transcriptional regulator [Mycolicibacterium crocinum]ULN41727.1 MarR family winged helix-turn-helix transcriptional regulator [Mycolicibacterium crocinum]